MNRITKKILITMLLGLTACGGGSSDDNNNSPINPTKSLTSTPETAVTENITFTNGTVKQGLPPAAGRTDADLGPNDPLLETPVSTATPVSAGGKGSLDIVVSNLPTNANFTVDIRFGSNATQYIQVPISKSITNGATSGTFNIPFNIGSAVCDNVSSVQHQIQCYESVNVGGVNLSKEQARQMVLACGPATTTTTGPSGAGSYCAYNYPKNACDILINQNSTSTIGQWYWNAGSGIAACGAFANAGYTQDYGFGSNCASMGGCGACAVGFNTAASPKPSVYTEGNQVPEMTIEEALIKSLESSIDDGTLLKGITFTPAE